MKVAYICPSCRATINAPASLQGESSSCPKCNADVDRWPAPISSPGSVRVVPPPEPAIWHYSVNGARRGPVTFGQLKSLVEGAALRPSDLIWREGLPAWVEAGTVPELFPASAPAKPVPSPMPVPAAPPPVAQPAARQFVEPKEEEDEDRRPRRRLSPKRTIPWLIPSATAVALVLGVGLVLFFVIAETRYQALGNRLVFNGGELYYTSTVTRAEAERLGNHLVRSGFFNGDLKSVQLHREGRWYQFRLVVKKGIEHDLQYTALLKQFIEELSREVFSGQPVEIHLCDDHLKTIRTVVNPSVR